MIVRNKNAILELLTGGARFERIAIASGLNRDELTNKIVDIATKNKVPISIEPILKMAHRRNGESHEVVAGYLIPNNNWTLPELLGDLYKKKKDPFFLLINRIDFENNIGVIARTAFAAGVNGLIYQGDEERFFNEETLHFSIGSIARIPLVKINIFEALKEMKRNAITTYSVQMGGVSIYEQNLSGPAAFVLGAEDKGVSDEIANRCDKEVSIPMRQGIDSLNVAVSAGIVLFEKVRQEGLVRQKLI